jgi:hypothetical protein
MRLTGLVACCLNYCCFSSNCKIFWTVSCGAVRVALAPAPLGLAALLSLGASR